VAEKRGSKIAELKRNNSLVAYVQRYTELVKRGEEWWGCCPFHGERTPSFAVKAKNGEEVFFCQGCGKGGDIIRFIELKEHLDTKAAIAKLGGGAAVEKEIPQNEDPEWKGNYEKLQQTFPMGDLGQAAKAKNSIPYASWFKKEQALQANAQAIEWLESVRGISASTAKDMHFGYVQSITGTLKPEDEDARDKGWICFPRIKDGKVVAIKMRSIVSKAFSQVVGMDGRALFNIETVNGLEPVFLVEGELDAAIMEQAGFRAVSIPSASSHKITPDMLHILKQAPRIYLAGDNDGGVGNVAMEQLAMTLGEGTYILKWPDSKDANDFFRGPCNRDIAVMQERMAELMRIANQTKAIGFTHVLAQLEEEEEGVDLENDPDRLHFKELDVDRMAYCPLGGVVVPFSTYTSTGKSVWVNQIAIHEAKRGEVVVSYTPEIAGREYLALLAAQVLSDSKEYAASGIDRSGKVSRELFQKTANALRPTYHAITKLTGKEWPAHFHPKPVDEIEFYPGYKLPEGTMDEQLDFIEYVVRVIRPTRFIIDTLMRIAIPVDGEGEVQAQSRAAKRFEEMGKTWGCVFILVGQSNKESDRNKEIKKDEYGVLRGSREIKDVAYSIYLLHRKKSERANDDAILENSTELILDKGRVTPTGGRRRVWLEYIRKYSRFVLGTGPNNNLPEPSGGGTLDESAPTEDENNY